jgi:hypothetical protein
LGEVKNNLDIKIPFGYIKTIFYDNECFNMLDSSQSDTQFTIFDLSTLSKQCLIIKRKEENMPYGDQELLRIVGKYIKNCKLIVDQATCMQRILNTGSQFQRMTARAARAGVCHAMVVDWIARKKVGAPTSSRLYNNNKRFASYVGSQIFTAFFRHFSPEGTGVTSLALGMRQRQVDEGNPRARGTLAAGLVIAGACVKSKPQLVHDLGRVDFKASSGGHTIGFHFPSGTKAVWFDPNCGEFEFADHKEFQRFFVDIYDHSMYSALCDSYVIHTFDGFPNNVKELWETSLGQTVL